MYIESREKRKIEAVYNYVSINGEYAYTKIRLEGKKMLFGILKDGRFEYGLKGRNKKEFSAIFGSVPRIKEAIERNEPIFIPEGEKDVNTLVKKGYTAFSCGGANDWNKNVSELCTGAEVVILADNDAPGKKLAAAIEKDAALERRFQPVMVSEPSVEDTIAILRGLKERYEVHHGVRITDAAIVAAATLSDRYISDRFLPDKAVDLVDEAAARLKIELDSMPTEIDQIEREAMQLEMERQALAKEEDADSKARLEKITKDLADLKEKSGSMIAKWKSEKEVLDAVRREQEKIEALKLESERAKRMGDLTRASEITYGELPEAQRALTEGKEKLSKMQKEDGGLLKEEVTEGDIAKVVATWTGIPAARLQEGERAKLVHMEERLGARVIGQKQAVKAVSDAVRRARAGLQDENRPIGSFLFLGPTGVGKTELSKALAEFLFDSENAIVRIDMSEYMEKHSVARLIGAPPGYVGYEEGGQLSEAVRRRPYCVVLFDEIEKAHPDVFNVLLQVLDDGRITDGQGRTVDFRNTVIIMTSNIGSQYILNEANAEQREAKALEALRGHFRPEFLNRIDEIIIFDRLTAQELKGIVDIQLQRVRRRLEAKGLFLRMTPEATALVADHGFDPVYGARPLKRAIQHDLLDPLSLKLLEGDFPEGTEIVVREKDGKLDFTKEKR